VPAAPFPISSPRDLLAKAGRELQSLEAETGGFWGDPRPVPVADLTINTAWSLWHVTDWIGHGADDVVRSVVTAGQMRLPARKRVDAFQRRLRARCPELRITWALALRWKHFDLETAEALSVLEDAPIISSPPAFGFVAVASPEEVVTISLKPSREVNYSLGPMASPSSPGSFSMHPKVTYRKQRLRVVDVFKKTHEYLEQLLQEHRL